MLYFRPETGCHFYFCFTSIIERNLSFGNKKGGNNLDVYGNVCKAAAAKGVSLAKIERDIDLGNGTIGKWKTMSPKLETVLKVADYFGVTIDELIGGKA